MAAISALTDGRGKQHPAAAPDVDKFTMRMPPDLRRRFRVAAAEEDVTYAKFLSMLLDIRDDRIARAKRQQRGPLDVTALDEAHGSV